ncbi:MAG: 30S ribosomal protein S12 methylthiotransferase RimO [Lachnospiraceae bacterium]|nr:30S ribosomal protein S12 methylthiotransferase RimO [Lachnospiraceae bacterium]
MKVLMVSLGCDKNRVDAEMMLGTLAARGFEITEKEEEADIAIVNSCCFIGDAKKESINTIFEMAQLKETAQLKLLVVTGCLGVRYKDEILKEIPEIDAVVGISAEEKIADVLEKALKGDKISLHEDLSRNPEWQADRKLVTGSVSAYLKIAEGCDKNCTYCVIPSVRGHFRSYPMEKLVEQARKMADNGVKELILVAQETTLYGVDLYGEKSLHRLMKALCEIEGIHWIRLLYAYPEEIYDELLEVMATEPKICHYIDMPIQHASDHILKKMNRRTDRASILDTVKRVREAMPDVVLRTTLLTGFPGETEEDVEDLKRFIHEAAFDRLGVFAYSREEDTPAASFKDQVPQREKTKRRNALMAGQQTISAENGQRRIGSLMETIIEGYLPEEGVYVGRTYGDAPDVDGYVFIESDREWMSGDFLTVRITDAFEYDLQGVPENEFTE